MSRGNGSGFVLGRPTTTISAWTPPSRVDLLAPRLSSVVLGRPEGAATGRGGPQGGRRRPQGPRREEEGRPVRALPGAPSTPIEVSLSPGPWSAGVEPKPADQRNLTDLLKLCRYGAPAA